MPGGVAVEPVGGDAYRITVRGHTVLVDRPTGGGGDDRGPVHNTLADPPAVDIQLSRR